MSKYYRVHTADIAWITQQPRGIFTAIGKLVEAKTLTEEETAEYWKNREYFERGCQFHHFMSREIQITQQPGLKTPRKEMIFTIR